jgi:hypothetical protein
VKLVLGSPEREETAINVTLMVIVALVLQNLVLVAALSRFALPDLVHAGRALIKVAIVVMTGPIGMPILALGAVAAAGLLFWAVRRPATRRLEVVR